MNKMTMTFAQYAKYVQDNNIHNIAVNRGCDHSTIDLNKLKNITNSALKIDEFSIDTFTAYLYHEGCADGISAVLVQISLARLKNEFNIEEDNPIINSSLYVPVNYGQELPVLPSNVTRLVVFDFSFDEQTLIEAYPNIKDIMQLDHHKTAAQRAESKYKCASTDCVKHGLFKFSELMYDKMDTGHHVVDIVFHNIENRDSVGISPDSNTVVYANATTLTSLYNNNTNSGAGLALFSCILEYLPKIIEDYPDLGEEDLTISALYDYVNSLYTYEAIDEQTNTNKPMFPYGSSYSYRNVIKNILLDIIKLAMYAEDRDLWLFKYGSTTKAYNMWLMDTFRSYDNGAFSVFYVLVDSIVTYDYEDLHADHVTLDEALKSYISVVEYDDNRKMHTSKVAEKIIDSDGRIAYICAYTGKDSSDVASMILDSKQDAQYVMMYATSSKEVYWSVRSRNGLAKVIAEQNGGGGHDNAAGFRSKLDMLLDIYSKVVKD